ncbi:MAG: tetratricopeptide (TPR) repeat protein [Planctomycetota bacterium]|jgi:tetratricopeptide (TPR) repeat protein
MNLGFAFLQLSRFEDAEREAREVFERRCQLFGDTSPEAARSAVPLAQSILAHGRFKEAYDLLQQFSGDEALPEIGILMDSIGTQLLLAEGRLAEARELAEYVFDDSIAFYGERHPQAIEATEILAKVMIAQRDFDLAQGHLETTYKLRNEIYGADSPLTWRTANNLAVVLGYQGIREQQEALLRDCLPRMRSEWGESHEEVLNASNNLACCLSATGRIDEALPLYLDVLHGAEEKYGAKSVKYVTALNNLAFTYQRGGKLEEAARYFVELDSLLDDVLPPEHYLAAAFRLNAGRVLVALDRFEEAVRVLQLSLQGFLAIQGEEGPQVFAVRALLEDAGATSLNSD